MNKDKQIAALAEFDGWELVKIEPEIGIYVDYFWRRGTESILKLPDYLTDLNVINRVEKKLKFSLRQRFYNKFILICSRQLIGALVSTEFCIHAAADERAEAILQTIDKWEE